MYQYRANALDILHMRGMIRTLRILRMLEDTFSFGVAQMVIEPLNEQMTFWDIFLLFIKKVKLNISCEFSALFSQKKL